MTDEEEANWQADRRVVRDYTTAKMQERFREGKDHEQHLRRQADHRDLEGRTDHPRCSGVMARGVQTPGIPDQETRRNRSASRMTSGRGTPRGSPNSWSGWIRLSRWQITPEEEADWLAWRRKNKEYELANFDKRVEGLFE